MDRGDSSHSEWELIGPLQPPERGRWARPVGDDWRLLNGIVHVLRSGAPEATFTTDKASGTRFMSEVPAWGRTGRLRYTPANAGRPRAHRRPAARDRQHLRSLPRLGGGRERERSTLNLEHFSRLSFGTCPIQL